MAKPSVSRRTQNGYCCRLGPCDIFQRVSHTVPDKQKLLGRVRRTRGQVEAVERGLDAEVGCERIMHLLASTRPVMAGLMTEVIEDHVLTHMGDPAAHPGALNEDAAEQLLSVVRTYLK